VRTSYIRWLIALLLALGAGKEGSCNNRRTHRSI
jgi:hypothetical protein